MQPLQHNHHKNFVPIDRIELSFSVCNTDVLAVELHWHFFSFPNNLLLVNQYIKKLLWARRESNPHLRWLKARSKTNNLLQTQISFNMSSGPDRIRTCVVRFKRPLPILSVTDPFCGATGIRTLNFSVQARCVSNYIHSPKSYF